MSTGCLWNDVANKGKCLKKNWTKHHSVYYKSYVENIGTEPRYFMVRNYQLSLP